MSSKIKDGGVKMATKTRVELEITCRDFGNIEDFLEIELEEFNNANKPKVEVEVLKIKETMEVSSGISGDMPRV